MKIKTTDSILNADRKTLIRLVARLQDQAATSYLGWALAFQGKIGAMHEIEQAQKIKIETSKIKRKIYRETKDMTCSTLKSKK